METLTAQRVVRSGTSSRRWLASLMALAVSATHFASFDIFTRPIVTDVRFFLYYAWRVTEGAVPHLDFFENKPQLATFAGALLYELGEFAGVDPLLAIRFGYLAIAAALFGFSKMVACTFSRSIK